MGPPLKLRSFVVSLACRLKYRLTIFPANKPYIENFSLTGELSLYIVLGKIKRGDTIHNTKITKQCFDGL